MHRIGLDSRGTERFKIARAPFFVFSKRTGSESRSTDCKAGEWNGEERSGTEPNGLECNGHKRSVSERRGKDIVIFF